MPPEVYGSVLRSIYGEMPTLVMGSATIAIGIFFTAYLLHSTALYICGVVAILISIGRVLEMNAFRRRAAGRKELDDGHHWELRFTLGAVSYMALCGVWCAITFQYDDALAQLFSYSTTIGGLLGVAARSYGSDRLVSMQLVGTAVPILVGLLITPGGYGYVLLGLFLIPFFLSLRSAANRLRSTLLDAVIATHEMTLLAQRFDTALNNMPHGLAMFDAEHRLVVANARLGDVLRLPFKADRKGQTVRELLLDCVEAGILLRTEFEALADELDRRLSVDSPEHMQLETVDSRALELAFQQMENGGSVVLIEDITERRNAENRIRHLARYDALTELPNRTYFHDQLDRVLLENRSHARPCALLFVDLDQFKQVNDTLGHPSGDALLCQVAERIKEIIDETDLVARFGGDEFVVLRPSSADAEEAAMLAGGIVSRLGEPYDIGGHEVVIGASVGIALAPRDGNDADQILKNADMALYRAKADGRGAWRFFEPEMDVRARARRELELDLRAALANDSFQVFFQPLYNLHTKRISTCEALIRWPHPERGMISPAEFIPVAEEMGLIVDIGTRVLQKACAECMEWPDEVHVAVNLSAVQFRRGNIPAVVREALAASGLPGHRLEIEITESVLIQDAQAARLALEQIREMGVRISLDDFGTGYSSLSYLHSFPLHKVKIDRSFVTGLGRNERALTLLRGVTRLSAELGMAVAVEGIETEEQLALVAAGGTVDEAQGYLFSPAVSGKQIKKLLFTPTSQLEKVA
jgi:diguanylate cyclase (GGDEF)-like protein